MGHKSPVLVRETANWKLETGKWKLEQRIVTKKHFAHLHCRKRRDVLFDLIVLCVSKIMIFEKQGMFYVGLPAQLEAFLLTRMIAGGHVLVHRC